MLSNASAGEILLHQHFIVAFEVIILPGDLPLLDVVLGADAALDDLSLLNGILYVNHRLISHLRLCMSCLSSFLLLFQNSPSGVFVPHGILAVAVGSFVQDPVHSDIQPVIP